MPTTPSRGSFGSAEPDAGDSAIAEVSNFILLPLGSGPRRKSDKLLLSKILRKAERPGRIIYVGKHHKVMRKSSSLKAKVVD